MKLMQRLISGFSIAIAWVLIMRYLPGSVMFSIFLICALLCQWEFYKLARQGGYVACDRLGIALGAAWFLAVFVMPRDISWEGPLLVFGGFLVLFWLLFDKNAVRPLESAAVTLLGIFYVPFMMSYLIRLAQWNTPAPMMLSTGGVFMAFYLALVVKTSDGMAFAVGTKLGRHKMLPRISPGKSWEGLAGGLSMAVASSVAVVAVVHHCPNLVPVSPLSYIGYTQAVALGLVMGILGVIGDLVESMFKRAVNAKDSSGTIPGMGGLLDVFDSLFFVPAAMYLILPVFQP